MMHDTASEAYFTSDPPIPNIGRDHKIGVVFLVILFFLMKLRGTDTRTIIIIIGPSTPIPTLPPEPVNDTDPITDPELYSYDGPGLQCSDGYMENAVMAKVDFCRHFGLKKEVFVGKYFVDRPEDQTCYLIADPEIEEGPRLSKKFRNFFSFLGISTYKDSFHSYQPGRMKFMNHLRIGTRECRMISFISTLAFDVDAANGESSAVKDEGTLAEVQEKPKPPVTEFVLARAYVLSMECGVYELIPALYSVDRGECYFTRAGSQLQRSKDCQVLCDHPDAMDEWHANNEPNF